MAVLITYMGHFFWVCLVLNHSWASLIAQLVKNTAAMQETPARFLGWEDGSSQVYIHMHLSVKMSSIKEAYG